MRSRAEIEHDDAGRMIRRAGPTHRTIAFSPHETELREWRLERS